MREFAKIFRKIRPVLPQIREMRPYPAPPTVSRPIRNVGWPTPTGTH